MKRKILRLDNRYSLPAKKVFEVVIGTVVHVPTSLVKDMKACLEIEL